MTHLTGLLALSLGCLIGTMLLLWSMSREIDRIAVRLDRGVAALQADAEATHKLLVQHDGSGAE